MTARTRRTVILSVLAVAIMLPVETILLRALSVPDQQTEARQWVATLSGSELDDAASDIQSYPFSYRKEIMRALTPSGRSRTWRAHLDQYVIDIPGLPAGAMAAVDDARDALSADAFANPSQTVADAVRAAATELEQFMARDEVEYLLYRLGPEDGTFASREPITNRLANVVRGWFVATANQEDCECSVEFGCGTFFACDDSTGCTPDEDWPMCGWGWMEPCDGLCSNAGL